MLQCILEIKAVTTPAKKQKGSMLISVPDFTSGPVLWCMISTVSTLFEPCCHATREIKLLF